MSSKTKWVLVSVLVTLFLFTYRPDRTELLLDELELPKCDITERLNTTITFYVDRGAFTPKLQNRLTAAIEYANQVLDNSCIPMRRTLDAMVSVDLNLSGQEDEYGIYYRLLDAVGADKMVQHDLDMHHYYVIVIGDEHTIFDDGTTGIADLNNDGSRSVLLSDVAKVHVLEHEFGHLAWAQHKDTWPFPSMEGTLKLAVEKKFHDKLKRYARAYTCKNAGTVMSYEERIVPIYSSPLIHYRGAQCGDPKVADNARVLREYAWEQLSKLNIREG